MLPSTMPLIVLSAAVLASACQGIVGVELDYLTTIGQVDREGLATERATA